MANTGRIDNIDVENAYAQSFGNLSNKTTYNKMDVNSILTGSIKSNSGVRDLISESFEAGVKAHGSTAGGAGTAGYAMVPIFVDPKIIDQSRKYTPLTEAIPRVTNRGTFADYNVIVSKGGAFSAAEDAALSETDTVYDRKSTAMKYLYAVGRVTGQSVAAQPSYVLSGMNPAGGAVGAFNDVAAPNSMQQETLVKARELKELEENMIINGNATTSGISGNPNGTEFDGIVTLMGATNTVDKNTGALAFSDFDLAIRYAFDDGGRPNLAVADSSSFTDTLALLSAKIGFLQPSVQTDWGFSAIRLNTMVGVIPMIPSMFLSTTSGSKAIYFLDLEVVEMRVLQDMTYEELAKTNDSRKFMIKMYEALIIRNPSFCASITEIA